MCDMSHSYVCTRLIHMCVHALFTCLTLLMQCDVVGVVAVCCSVLQCDAVCCSVLQCVVMCCSVLQCDVVGVVAVCCNVDMPHSFV